MPRPPIGVLLAGGGSPIDLDGSFFAQLAIFFAAFLILQHLVFRPVTALFDAREAAMEGAKADAENSRPKSPYSLASFTYTATRDFEAAAAVRDQQPPRPNDELEHGENS